MLLSPHGALPQRLGAWTDNAGSDGVTVTAGGSANTLGAWAEVIASTPFDAVGVLVHVDAGLSSSVVVNTLVNIGRGAASSEEVLIPNLMAGHAEGWSGSNMEHSYFFPLFIPAGTRLSAQAQSVAASRAVDVGIWLVGGPRVPSRWCGNRVTAYGANTAASTGTVITPGTTPSWSSAVQMAASTANPIRALQMAMDLGTDLSAFNRRYIGRVGVGSSTQWIAEAIPFSESSAETVFFSNANWLLSQMAFDIPAGSDLRFAAMGSGAEARNFILYGVD